MVANRGTANANAQHVNATHRRMAKRETFLIDDHNRKVAAPLPGGICRERVESTTTPNPVAVVDLVRTPLELVVLLLLRLVDDERVSSTPDIDDQRFLLLLCAAWLKVMLLRGVVVVLVTRTYMCDVRYIYSDISVDNVGPTLSIGLKIARSLHYFFSCSRARSSVLSLLQKRLLKLLSRFGTFVLRRPFKGPHHLESHRSLCVWSRRERKTPFRYYGLQAAAAHRRGEEEEKEEKKKTRVRRLVPEEEMPLSDTKEDIIVIIIIFIIIIINERTRSRALGSPMRSRSSRSTRIR